VSIDWSKLDKTIVARFLALKESDILEILPRSLRLKADLLGGATFEAIIYDRLSDRVMALLAALEGEDDLGAVVRAHIHIEHELQELIFFAAPCPSQLKRFEDMEFSEKVQLALVLGLNPELKGALSAAGTLRNKFSHKLDMKLTKDHARDLISKLTSDMKLEIGKLRKLLTDHQSKRLARLEQSPRGQVEIFFLATFIDVSRERDRLGFERFDILTR
jgi:hypothetical protein